MEIKTLPAKEPYMQIYKRWGKPQTPGGAACSGVFHENPAYN